MTSGAYAVAAQEFQKAGFLWVWEALEGWPHRARLRCGNDAALYVLVNGPENATVYTCTRIKLLEAFSKAPEKHTIIVERLSEPAPAEEIHVVVSDGEQFFAFFYAAKEMLS